MSFGQLGGSPAAAVSGDPTLPDQVETVNKIPDWLYVILPIHPVDVFVDGIRPLGTDVNIIRHAYGNVRTGYVPAVSDIEEVGQLGAALADRARYTGWTDLWVYQIRPTSAFYDLTHSLTVMGRSSAGLWDNRVLAEQANTVRGVTYNEWAGLGPVLPAQVYSAFRLSVSDLTNRPATTSIASLRRNITMNYDTYREALTAANVHVITNPDYTGIAETGLIASISPAQASCSLWHSSRAATSPEPCETGSFTPYLPSSSDTRGLTPSFESQTIPTIAAGQTNTAVVRMTSNLSTVSDDGTTFAITAPAETILAGSCVEFANSADAKGGLLCGKLSNSKTLLKMQADGLRFPGATADSKGWYTLGVRLQANADIKAAGGKQCGSLTFTAGPAVKAGVGSDALCYSLAVADPSFSAQTIPALTSRSSGLAVVKMSNTLTTETPNGAQFTMTAPSGTTFADTCARYANSLDTTGGCLSGQLNNTKTTLTVSSNGLKMPPKTSYGDGWYTLGAQLKADDTTSQTPGQKCGRLDFASGSAVRVGAGSQSLCVDLRVVDPKFAIESVPTLNAGSQALATLRMTNNITEKSPNGAQFTLTAPVGTTFADACAHHANSLDITGGCLTGQLNSARTTLTVSADALQFPGNDGTTPGWYMLGAQLKADSPLQMTGRSCGTVMFTGGSAIRIGATSGTSFCFTAVGPR